MGKDGGKPKKSVPSPVSMGAVVTESLPFPLVYYPNHYGTFFAFAEDESAPVALCACSRSALDNLVRLKKASLGQKNIDSLRETLLDSWFFPDVIAEISLRYGSDALGRIRFVQGLCHRCNFISPSLRYCHEMYGTQFIQYHGWYVNQAYLRLGIHPLSLDYLPSLCPKEYQEKIDLARAARKEFKADEERLVRIASRALRVFTKEIEDSVRQEFGFRKVGEGWVSETMLYHLVSRILDDYEITRHHRPEWLGLELDIYIPGLRLAFEYQGQQHFHPIKAWGGQKALDQLIARDALKSRICKQEGVTLITIDYTEPLTEDHIRKVLAEHCVPLA